MNAPLPATFYDRSTRSVARALLGCRIVHRSGSVIRAARIVETEAYGPNDPASHAFRGPTPRNSSMFEGPGTLYVYRIHQVYCANVVTRRGQAVLLRAAAPLSEGLGSLRGPGRLCRELGIGPALDHSSVITGPVRIFPREVRIGKVAIGPRVGISKAVERPLRFAIADDPNVSRPRPVT